MICRRRQAPASKGRLRGEGRRAFTLVELMVSMALIVFIMTILSAAFGAASKAFRDLKAVGDMAEKLRGVLTLMRRDLAAPHFDGNRKLSDSTFWGNGPALGPPSQGFFRIWQDQLPSPVGNENPTFSTSRSMLHFTATLPGALPSDFFATQVPMPGGAPLFTSPAANQENRYQPVGGPTFRSPSAEVAYWLVPSLDASGNAAQAGLDTGAPQPLFTLCRRQRLLWPPEVPITVSAPVGPGYEEVSAPAYPAPGPATVNRLQEVTIPPFRLAMGVNATPGPPATDSTYAGLPAPLFAGTVYPSPFAPAGSPTGRVDDVLLTEVLSFDVRILLQGDTVFRDLADANVQAFSNKNKAFPSITGPWVFDTWSAQNVGGYAYNAPGLLTPQPWQVPDSFASIPLFKNGAQLIQVRAIQITLRVWDSKTQLVRQSSMVQDL